eukprot:jgi/Bigna1/137166/aug1.37_g11874
MSNVSELFQGWKASGITTKLKLDRWGDVRVMGSEYISINAWPYPWSMLKGSWEYVMGINSSDTQNDCQNRLK